MSAVGELRREADEANPFAERIDRVAVHDADVTRFDRIGRGRPARAGGT